MQRSSKNSLVQVPVFCYPVPLLPESGKMIQLLPSQTIIMHKLTNLLGPKYLSSPSIPVKSKKTVRISKHLKVAKYLSSAKVLTRSQEYLSSAKSQNVCQVSKYLSSKQILVKLQSVSAY